MNLIWVDGMQNPIEDEAIQNSDLGRWIIVQVGTLTRNSGLPGTIRIVFESPDKLGLWFQNEKGTHGTLPKFVLTRTIFEVEEYSNVAKNELEKHFQKISQT